MADISLITSTKVIFIVLIATNVPAKISFALPIDAQLRYPPNYRLDECNYFTFSKRVK